jgi:hypothetical protein
MTFRKVVVSTAREARTENWRITSQEVTPGCEIAWSITGYTLHGGRQEGVELIEVDNGKLKFGLVPTRGMALLSATVGDVRLGWDSPVREVVNPAFVNLDSYSYVGWLTSFNEWMCRCGLESNGYKGLDEYTSAFGLPESIDLAVHGKVSNMPACEVEVVVDEEPPYRLRIRGRVEEPRVLGPVLALQTETSTEPGSASLRIDDEITNLSGAEPQEFEILYHTNFGPPLLEEGAQLVVPAQRVSPFIDADTAGAPTYAQYAGPTPGFVNQIYNHRLYGDEQNRTGAVLRNKAGDLAASMFWSLDELPYLCQWKNTGAPADGYVTGIEPATNFPYNRAVERKQGRVPVLHSGESHRIGLDIGVHIGTEEVAAASRRIADIQAGRPTEISDSPVELE